MGYADLLCAGYFERVCPYLKLKPGQMRKIAILDAAKWDIKSTGIKPFYLTLDSVHLIQYGSRDYDIWVKKPVCNKKGIFCSRPGRHDHIAYFNRTDWNKVCPHLELDRGETRRFVILDVAEWEIEGIE